jgi:hypothetical protein
MARKKAKPTNGATPDPTKLNGQGPATPATGTSEQTEQISWDVAFPEAKTLVAKLREHEQEDARIKLRLGELADKVVHPKYRDRTFAKFANKLGINKNEFGHYRTAWRKWGNILPPGAKCPPFAVLKEVASLPNRAELIKAEPHMTKRRAGYIGRLRIIRSVRKSSARTRTSLVRARYVSSCVMTRVAQRATTGSRIRRNPAATADGSIAKSKASRLSPAS